MQCKKNQGKQAQWGGSVFNVSLNLFDKGYRYFCGSKILKMKKTLILLLMCAPLALFAQTKSKDKKGKDKAATEQTKAKEKPLTKEQYNEQQDKAREDKKGAKIVSDWIYIEVSFQPASGNSTFKIDLANTKEMIRDKNLAAALNQAKARRYTSVSELLNVLGAEGFEIVTTYTVTAMGSENIHFILKGENRAAPTTNAPLRGVGNTMSRENPGMSTKKK
jgi:hypothetical protein